ncbi:hypothetical protein AAFF_G00325630 [Aldrovandia affinis]|uniref:Uncharacterized protein n=1 Tax=Aldrovandia affinis TaxID=143900 RepID=A0AAD7X1C6_9TELE|nr:hypothetical protein AAFF_G00325630 [Aldrovandia affinis]
MVKRRSSSPQIQWRMLKVGPFLRTVPETGRKRRGPYSAGLLHPSSPHLVGHASISMPWKEQRQSEDFSKRKYSSKSKVTGGKMRRGERERDRETERKVAKSGILRGRGSLL